MHCELKKHCGKTHAFNKESYKELLFASKSFNSRGALKCNKVESVELKIMHLTC